MSGSGTITLGEGLTGVNGTARQGSIMVSSDAGVIGTVSANLGAQGGLVIGDAGTAPNVLLLTGNNQIIRGIVVNNGILRLGSDGALNANYFNDVVLRAGNSGTTGATSTALQVNGNNVSVLFAGNDRLQGSTRIQNASATAGSITIVTNAASASNDGVMENGTGGGALSLAKRGSAQLTLEQNNT